MFLTVLVGIPTAASQLSELPLARTTHFKGGWSHPEPLRANPMLAALLGDQTASQPITTGQATQAKASAAGVDLDA